MTLLASHGEVCHLLDAMPLSVCFPGIAGCSHALCTLIMTRTIMACHPQACQADVRQEIQGIRRCACQKYICAAALACKDAQTTTKPASCATADGRQRRFSPANTTAIIWLLSGQPTIEGAMAATFYPPNYCSDTSRNTNTMLTTVHVEEEMLCMF